MMVFDVAIDKLEINNEIKLAKKLQLCLNEIPVFLRQRAARILDDLIVIINWRSPWSHGGAGQIKRSL
ncbi:hypothetical protein GLOIN_2v1638887 [Rhizophagus irregularis DAOM 181602=DAOM 197198]|nr:hypothetical protein GLOIN_2v1638887 [Rhizophagus irregularis DAOM 181602=DAOM 197198]CAG8495300.1 2774_t:CDS:2 [Rhizophagus irregularis]